MLPCPAPPDPTRPTPLGTASELDAFLAQAERRAWLHARFAVRNDETAADIVQDAMMRLAERYAAKPAEEWPMLFQRILQNAIRDHWRRQKVRDTWTALVSTLMPRHREEGEENAESLLERIADPTAHGESAADEAERRQRLAVIAEVMQSLPARQREAFLLRYWDGYDIVETAGLMGCSEGSVKTHCSRASQALARALRERGIEG